MDLLAYDIHHFADKIANDWESLKDDFGFTKTSKWKYGSETTIENSSK